MPDRPHEARHRAGHPVSSRHDTSAKRQATSKPGRVLAGLALPTAATVALMFGTAAAAVATTSKAQTGVFTQSAAAMVSPQPAAVEPAAMRARHAKEIAQAQAADLKATADHLAFVRAADVARSLERRRLAERADASKRAAFAHSWRLPIKNPVTTSGFGYRWGSLHAGEDFAVSEGTPLASMSTGTVAFAGQESGYGNLVQIRYWDGTISYYGHMSRISVTEGDVVAPGQIVGFSGNTGHSTGPHLHLEIHPNGGQAIDPLPWLARHNIAT